MKVRVIYDCRPGNPKTGAIGNISERVVNGVTVCVPGGEMFTMSVEDFQTATITGDGGEVYKLTDVCPPLAEVMLGLETIGSQDDPRQYLFYVTHETNAITFDDGDVLQGSECWWELVTEGVDMIPLEQAQIDIERLTSSIRGLMQAVDESVDGIRG